MKRANIYENPLIGSIQAEGMSLMSSVEAMNSLTIPKTNISGFARYTLSEQFNEFQNTLQKNKWLGYANPGLFFTDFISEIGKDNNAKYLYKESFDFLSNSEIENETYEKKSFIKKVRNYFAHNQAQEKIKQDNFRKALEIVLEDKKTFIPGNFVKEFQEIVESDEFKCLADEFGLDLDFIVETIYGDGFLYYIIKEIVLEALNNIYELKNKIQTRVGNSIPLRFKMTEYFDIMFTYKGEGISRKEKIISFNNNTPKIISNEHEKRFNKIVVFLN